MNTTSVQSSVAINNASGNNNLTIVAKAVGVTSVEQVTKMTQRIAHLSAEAQEFEMGAYAHANQALYGLIQKAYALYKELTNAGDTALRFKKQGLTDYLDTKGLGKYSDKPLPQRIIAAVFGDSRGDLGS